MNPRQFDDSSYTEFRRSLLDEKGSEFQQEFLTATRKSPAFLKFVQDEVSRLEGDDFPIYENSLTEHEYKEPPPDTERALYEAWKEIAPAVACRFTFWAEVTFRHIEESRIQASYLAANGGSLSGGLERIDRVLSGEDKKAVDDCVRTILRRMSGLPEARGNRSLYVNCPFGCAWWRERITADICSSTGKARDDVLGILRLNKGYWEEIVSLIVSRNSVVGDAKVRDALVVCLIDQKDLDPGSSILNSKSLRQFCRLIGVRSARQELGVLDLPDLIKLIGEELKTFESSQTQ